MRAGSRWFAGFVWTDSRPWRPPARSKTGWRIAGAPGGHLLDDRPGQLDLAPRRVGRRELVDPRDPVGLLLLHDLEHDARVRRRPGRAALDGVGELIDGARVVPVLGRGLLRHPQERAVERGHRHRVTSARGEPAGRARVEARWERVPPATGRAACDRPPGGNLRRRRGRREVRVLPPSASLSGHESLCPSIIDDRCFKCKWTSAADDSAGPGGRSGPGGSVGT